MPAWSRQPVDRVKTRPCRVSDALLSPLVRSEPLTIAGLAGPVVVDSNSFTGRNTVTVNGQPVPRIGRRAYALPAAGGGTMQAEVRPGFFDPYPSLQINGVKHRTGPQVPMVLRILALVPIVLVGVGGLVGGLIGALGVIGNLAVARLSLPAVVKALLMLVVLAVAVVVWVIVAGAITSAIRS